MSPLLAAVAFSAPIAGERLSFEASWLGISAGVAEATVERTPEGWTATLKTRSADWLSGIYPVDDRVSGTWSTAGSLRYDTRYREGKFQLDQLMTFATESILVANRKLIDGEWKSWSDQYPAVAGLYDPLAAVYQLRESWGGSVQIDAFSGRKPVPVIATSFGGDSVKNVLDLPTEKVVIAVRYDNEVKQWMTVWFATDPSRVPVRAVVDTRGGPVTVELTERRVGP